ncbi:glycine reductase [Desulfovibrio sp. OttesenSCG-928-A18]|nr:glycine reductase [Desulfovibrio sp. OttesenSCG-928-A18]
MDESKRKLVADALKRIVDTARQGGPTVRVGLMAWGNELGEAEIIAGGMLAQREFPHIRVVFIGPKPAIVDDSLEWLDTPDCEADIINTLQQAMDEKLVAGIVAMHYPFPIGVATVGRIMTPGHGKPMFVASCTGSTAASRTEALLRNAIYGIAVARASGIEYPELAFLNLDGAGVALRSFKRLRDNGYRVSLGGSRRKEGGSLLRGNDIVSGAVDVLVCDTLTGNALLKVFSTYTTDGKYESMGWGYGPSVGEGWKRIVSIVSRASGAPVIANAISLTARVAKGRLPELAAAELSAAYAAGFEQVLEDMKPKTAVVEEIPMPDVVPVDAEITGVDVLDMENALHTLWKENIYAETAMGCTGPVIRVQMKLRDEAARFLSRAGFI